MEDEVGVMDGDICNRDGCEGILELSHVENCSCHINPPCQACVGRSIVCPVCGYDSADE